MRIQLLHNRWFYITLGIAVSIANGCANANHQLWGDWLAAALFGFYGVYCVQNFLYCRLDEVVVAVCLKRLWSGLWSKLKSGFHDEPKLIALVSD